MANYMKVDGDKLNADITSVADAIRENVGLNSNLSFPDQFVEVMRKDKIQDYISLIEGTIEHLESDTVTKIGDHALYEHNNLKSIRLPNSKSVESHGCCYCHNLEIADIGATYLDVNAFGGCEKLKVLILRADTVCELGAQGVFFNSPFGSGGSGGVAYVPADLVEAYKTTGFWQSFYQWGVCSFQPIEESEFCIEIDEFLVAFNNLPAKPSATEACKKAVAAVAIAYAALTDTRQQTYLANEIKTYLAFRARWIEISEATVIETANAIGTVTNTPECLAKIEAAEAAIASLGTDSLTKLADYISIVEAARQQYDEYQNTI